jgi:hypothetical protein
LVAASVSTALLGLAGPGERRAQADEHHYVQLAYESPAPASEHTCLDVDAFRRKLERRLGYDPVRADAPRELRVSVVARGGRFFARIALFRGGALEGKREIEDARCDSLGEAAASAAALALDPVAAGRGPSPEAPSEPAVPAPPEPSPPPTLAPPPAPSPPPAATSRDVPVPPPPRSTLQPLAYVDGSFMFGRAPGPTGGARIGLGARLGALSLAGEFQGETQLGAASATAPGGRTERIDMTALSFAAALCGKLAVVQLCPVLGLGTRNTRALDVPGAAPNNSLFVVAGGRLGVEVFVHPLVALRAHGNLGVPLRRPSYTVDNVTVWETPLAEGGLSFGLGGYLP